MDSNSKWAIIVSVIGLVLFLVFGVSGGGFRDLEATGQLDQLSYQHRR